jgi:hypothetical protein
MKEKDAVSKDILELVNRLPGLNYGSSDGERKHLDAIGILSLPEHLRKTALAVHRRLRVSAEKLSEITGRDVDVERANLEELVEMKYLTAVRDEEVTFYNL